MRESSPKMLRMWTVYRHPRDYPGKYVARLWEIDASGHPNTGSIVVSDTLESLQDELEAMGLVRLIRSPGDDPVIVETWL